MMKNLKLDIQIMIITGFAILAAILFSSVELSRVKVRIFDHGMHQVAFYAQMGTLLADSYNSLSIHDSSISNIEKKKVINILSAKKIKQDIGDDSGFFIFNSQGILLSSVSNLRKKAGENISDWRDDSGTLIAQSLMEKSDKDSVKYFTKINLQSQTGKAYYGYAKYYSPWGWYIVSYLGEHDLKTKYINDLEAVWFSFAMSVIVAIIIVLYLQFNVCTPLIRLNHYVQRILKNDLDFEVQGKDGKSELHTLASSLDMFKIHIKETNELREKQKRMAQEYEENQQQALNKLAEDFKGKVGQAVSDILSASDQLKEVQSKVSQLLQTGKSCSEAMLVTSENSAGNVQSVASASEELSASIGEITSQVTQSTRMTQKAVEEADEINATVKSLNEAATRVGEVVELIAGIAEQTNLLALNATIEAARAGDAGKGFTVVASEVKNLANRTAKATEEISSQISSMQKATAISVQAIAKITQIVSDINEIISGIASAVEEQSVATQEISRNAEFASTSTHETRETVKGMIETTSSTADMTNNMLSISASLQSQMSVLKDSTDEFLQILSGKNLKKSS